MKKEDAVRAALSEAEAALLPAMPRPHGPLGRAALQNQMQKAAKMGEMKVREAFDDLERAVKTEKRMQKTMNRAALHHVTRR